MTEPKHRTARRDIINK